MQFFDPVVRIIIIRGWLQEGGVVYRRQYTTPPSSMQSRVHKNKSVQRLISSLTMGHWHGEISSNVTFAYCTKGCIDVAVLRGRPLTHVDAKPKFVYGTFSIFFLHENSQSGCIKGKKVRCYGRYTQSMMEASIARKRTRFRRGVLRHQLAQVCASSCIMSCFSCAAMVFRYSKRARTFFT